MNAQQEQNLRNVVRALRESPNPDEFNMGLYGNACGTPACALGHYAARADLNGGRLVLLSEAGASEALLVDQNGDIATFCDVTVQHEFGLNGREARQLFDVDGCDRPQTATEAADFIEAFIERKKAAR